MVQLKIGKTSVKWSDMVIALALAAFGVYFLASGFVLQSTAAGVITPIISYIIGLALLFVADNFKKKATTPR